MCKLAILCSPVCFFCDSAGVGRTGTLLTIDVQMQRANNEMTVNPFTYVSRMRENRNHMVQTEVCGAKHSHVARNYMSDLGI